jgi:hypothetical protein
LLALSVFTGLAQNSTGQIKGRVSDKSNLQPIQGVSVAILKGSKVIGGTSTDASGKFQLLNLPLDTFTIQFSFIGYTTKKQLVIVDGSEKIIGNVLLEADAQNLKEITVKTNQIREMFY